MIVTSNECISKLVRRFVVQHETRDSLLAAVVYRLSLKDFERPDVVSLILFCTSSATYFDTY